MTHFMQCEPEEAFSREVLSRSPSCSSIPARLPHPLRKSREMFGVVSKYACHNLRILGVVRIFDGGAFMVPPTKDWLVLAECPVNAIRECPEDVPDVGGVFQRRPSRKRAVGKKGARLVQHQVVPLLRFFTQRRPKELPRDGRGAKTTLVTRPVSDDRHPILLGHDPDYRTAALARLVGAGRASITAYPSTSDRSSWGLCIQNRQRTSR